MLRDGKERGGRPLLLGHRGCRGAVPENSFEAFDKALADRCDGFEFDVRRTADARNVICHDATLDGLDIATAAFEALSQRLSNPPPRLFGATPVSRVLPCMDEVIVRYSGRAFLDIELKTTGLEEATVDLLRNVDAAQVVVSSFLPEVVERVHALDARIPVGFIFDSRRTMWLWEPLPVTHLMPHRALIKAALVDEWHGAGKKVIAWTVNDPREMERLASWGVDGVISDDTELLSRTLGGLR